ncbi:MAG: hypothetical protein QOF97_1126 [Acidimicrobiaceae bacterium]
MESSRIGQSLKTARARLGWSRETLAYHSSVSWSAIAQIESGRRKDVRLSSLSALANALGVSVDYLIGTAAATTTPHLFEHRVLTYGSDDEFLASTTPFLVEGAERSHGLLAVTTKAKMALLRDSLADHADHIDFMDWTDWYRSPAASLSRYGTYVKDKFDSGAVWIRVVGEAGWSDHTEAEIAEWTRYESMINLAFATSPTTIMCTYDERSFPEEVIADARRTHPAIAHGNESTASPAYREPEDFLVELR